MGFYVNPGSVIAIGIIFPVLCTTAVVGRFVTRFHCNSDLRVDDWLCLPALILTISIGAVYIYGGATNIIRTLPPDESLMQAATDPTVNISKLFQLEYVTNIISPLTTGLIRLSFLYFYRRIFRGKVFDVLTKTIIGAIIAWIIGMTIALLSVCGDHFSADWISLETNLEYCSHRMLNTLGALAVSGFIWDLIIFFIPFPWIWRLQMPLSQRWAVTSVFLCGLLTCGASGAKMAVGIYALQYCMLPDPGKFQNVLGLKSTGDLVGDSSVWMFWAYVEVGTGMIVCCLPSLKPMFATQVAHHFFVKLQSWSPSRSVSSWRSRNSSSEASSRTATVDNPEKGLNSITVTNTVDQYTMSRQT